MDKTFVVTVKPTPDARARVEYLSGLGFSAFRVNFARRAIADNVRLIHLCRDLSRQHGRPCTIFVDLPGNKVRLGTFAAGKCMLAAGDSFVLDVQSHVASTGQRASVNSSAFVAQCQPGDELVLGKGVHATVTDADHCQVVCRVTSGGSVYTCCGVANKSRYDPTEDLVEYDRRVLDSLGDGIDYVCPSFTDSRAKVLQVRNATDGPLQRKVMAKIESPMGVSQIVDIANHADGIMLCRGDLGSYYTHQEVHRLASIFAETSRVSGIELALATDFFESMDRSGMLSAEDQDELNFALSLCPNWIILNETSSSDAWRLIAETAASFMTQRQR